MDAEHWQEARLIPVSGIKGAQEQERRAASALLAVLSAVKEFGREILRPLGAPAGAVSTYCEVPFEVNGKKVRVDGLIRVRRARAEWTLLVEVKTASSLHNPEQVEAYLDVVRQEGFDGLLTISNTIVSASGQHPIKVDQRRFRNIPLWHLSWIRILSIAVRRHEYDGVSDPDQAWILQELIRYLEHENSGSLKFVDMGPEWVTVREEVKAGTLTMADGGREEVAARWDQLIQYICLTLGARLGEDVQPVLSRRERADPEQRVTSLATQLVASGKLTGAIKIPNSVGPIEIAADLRTMAADASVTLDAPDRPRPTTRVSWLVRQLRDAPPNLRISASFPHTKTTTSALLREVRTDPAVLIAPIGRLPRSFTVTLSAQVGANRKHGKRSFIDDVAAHVERFYGEIVQDLKAWTAAAPRLVESEVAAEDAAVVPPSLEAVPEATGSEQPVPSTVVRPSPERTESPPIPTSAASEAGLLLHAPELGSHEPTN